MAKLVGERLSAKRLGSKVNVVFKNKEGIEINLGLLNLDDIFLIKREANEIARFIIAALPARRNKTRPERTVMIDEDFVKEDTG